MLATWTTTTAVAALLAVVVASLLFGLVAFRLAQNERCWFRERWVAWRFWWRSYFFEECGPVLYWVTVAMCIVALLVLIGMASG